MLTRAHSGKVLRMACLLLALGLAAPKLAAGAAPSNQKKDLRPADSIKVLKRKSAPPEDRATGAKELAGMSNAAEVRDFQVIEALLDVAKDKNDDIFVRIECIEGLGKLEDGLFKQDHLAKNKFIEVFMAILKDKAENTLVKEAVLSTFRLTLDRTALKDKEAFDSISKVAAEKTESELLRIMCVGAIGAFGDPKGIGVLTDILNQVPPPSEQLKTAVVQAFSELLTAVDNPELITFVMVKKITEFVSDTKYPPDLRADALKALARLKVQGVKGLEGLIGDITKILNTENEPKLLVAAIESLGILGDEQGLDALENAIKAFANDPKQNAIVNENRAKLRQVAMKALGDVLARQNARPNQGAIVKCTNMLIEPLKISEDKEARETDAVMLSAIFSLRYLYPKKKEFEGQQKRATEVLINRMRPINKPSDDMLEAIVKTLKAINEQPFGKDVKHWEEYLDKKK